MTLTAGTAVLTTTVNSGATPTTGFLTAGADTINAVLTAASSPVVQDATANDGDIFNLTTSSAAITPVVAGVETINLTSYGTGSLAFNNISGASALNIAGTAGTVTGLPASGVTITDSMTNGALVLNLLNSTNANDSMTVNLAATGTGHSLSFADAAGTIETVVLNVNSNSSLSGGVVLDGTSTFRITGAGNLTLGAVDTNTANASAVTTLDASGMTGGLTYTANGGSGAGMLTVVGGSGADSITLGAVNNNINTSAGNDTIVGGANLNANDTVNGGAGSDTLTLTARNASTDLDNVTGVESITLAAGASYTYLISNNSLFDLDTSAGTVTIDASALAAANALSFTGTNVDAHGVNLIGGAGADTLIGTTQADTIVGGAGIDAITGGIGNDTITITETTDAADTINIGAFATNGVDTVTGFVAGAAATDVLAFASPVGWARFCAHQIGERWNAGYLATQQNRYRQTAKHRRT